jgi:hypothetical protein
MIEVTEIAARQVAQDTVSIFPTGRPRNDYTGPSAERVGEQPKCLEVRFGHEISVDVVDVDRLQDRRRHRRFGCGAN